ncbi:sigma-54-dependent Fis family transcriptional regulator [Bacillus sp. FJAT-27225]|uniref:sigma-54 interaction domain-containing protein n=1 Tax=Bacillus sp. FJAT-27225 TaxID=1743144 RepID=UPI00080C3309|nr:sigma 54-interacting transcriptional regulator [Bacillus sp. FJAT-27225]OCA87963.1 sigma-54-dependent Fis family transcriptional regulator [Bacillus sp. FJAT-27225]
MGQVGSSVVTSLEMELLGSQAFLNTVEKIFDPISVPVILIGKDTKVKMINQIFADYLGFPKEEIIGKPVLEVDEFSRFPYVFTTKRPEIAWKHRFKSGKTAIVHRIPVLDENHEVAYGFGMLLFQDVKEFKDIIEKNKLLETALNYAEQQLEKIQGAKYSWENIIGTSEKMVLAIYMGRRASQTKSNVLLLGESGTGKELFAHAIHHSSNRARQRFVKVNCAAIPGELLESELFGYSDGAFTGAKKGGKPGKFELAHNGSIFLDEIGDMPLSMQAKLLRVLQEKEIERVGGTKTIPVDVRVIAATNKNLEKMVEEGTFREDLFYRLNVMSIEIPPLRERENDTEALANMLLKKLSSQLGVYVTAISKHAMEHLLNYHWPGNVRELENVLERAINLTDTNLIQSVHLPYSITKCKKQHKLGTGLEGILEETEKEIIKNCLEELNYNKVKVAEILNISRSSLYDKIEKYQLDVPVT